MLVDLFSDTSVTKFANKQRGYIKNRDISIGRDGYNKLLQYADQDTELLHELMLFKECAHGSNTVKHDKKFVSIAGFVSSDRFWKIELTGIPEFSKDYSIMIDLSDNLAEILSLLCGCDPTAVRRIPNYHDISNAIMNNNFDAAGSSNFGVFYDVDLNLNAYLAKTLYKSGEQFSELQDIERIVNHFIFTIMMDVLCKAEQVKTYIAAAIKNYLEQDTKDLFIIKSFTFSSVICTSAKDLGTNSITVRYQGNSFQVPLIQYRRMGILEG